jgi:hypothetical protein
MEVIYNNFEHIFDVDLDEETLKELLIYIINNIRK